MNPSAFGAMMKRLRQRTGKTMREFCLEHGFDPGNYSRVERGNIPPAFDAVLDRYARALGLIRNSPEWIAFFDTAAACRGQLPADLMTDDSLLSKLPIFFGALRRNRSPERLDKLIEMIRKA